MVKNSYKISYKIFLCFATKSGCDTIFSDDFLKEGDVEI